jgi:UDP-2-acetamido-3-amino-2,3-dideoxy-glucuronate N-acetyltransferase
MAKEKNVFIHESSYVDKGVKIGKGTRVWHFCHISKGAVIGVGCSIGQNVFIAEGVKIGNNVKVQNNVSVYSGVTLEDDVFCGPSMVFTNVYKPRSKYPVNKKYQKTLVKKGATIGANATIICGNAIGEYAFIGAGSVITKDVPDYALMYGAPAKIKGWVCECGERLLFIRRSEVCRHCSAKYEQAEKDAIVVKAAKQ